MLESIATGSARPKILQIISFSAVGGAEKNTYLLTKALAKRGFDCHLIYPPGAYARRFEELKELGASCYSMDFRRNPIKTLLDLRRLIKLQKFEIVHSHMYLADFFLWVAAIGLPNLIRISTLHVSIRNQTLVTRLRRCQQRLFSALAYRAFDKVFTVSESMRQEAIGYFALPSAKVITSLNAIDFEGMEVNEAVKSKLSYQHGLNKPTFKIVCVGSFHPLKSQITLIQSLGAHLYDLSDIEVYLIGDGVFKSGLIQAVRTFSLEERIHFTGIQENMNEWYSLVDMFVHTSFTEALSRSILEAMFMAIPIAASDIPSTREILVHGETGMLFSPGDALKLAQIIREFYYNRPLAARLAKNARTFVTKYCGIETMTDTILAHSLPTGMKSVGANEVNIKKGATP